MFGIQSLGAAAGPLICGMIADRWGLLMTFWFLAFTIIVANMLVFFMPKEDGAKAKAA